MRLSRNPFLIPGTPGPLKDSALDPYRRNDMNDLLHSYTIFILGYLVRLSHFHFGIFPFFNLGFFWNFGILRF